MIEIETLEQFDAHVRDHGSLEGVALQGLDLRSRRRALDTVVLDEAVFLGCRLPDDIGTRLLDSTAVVFPPLPRLPFRAFRASLYSPDELFAGFQPGDPATLARCPDTVIYRWAHDRRGRGDIVDELAQRIHDHAIDDALRDLLRSDGRAGRVVAVMGGHRMSRASDAYLRVARLARLLTLEGFFCASGGGPGAMEATSLGAWFADRPDTELADAVTVLAGAPTYEPVAEWLGRAIEVRKRWPLADPTVPRSVGIPTWHYGHEPPNVFATHVAKYFANSIREDGLLAIAAAGVVFCPGSAGTIQEVFQDAAQNHYEVFGVSPMVFLDTAFWTGTGVYPLLVRLSEGQAYRSALALYDEPESIRDFLVGFARDSRSTGSEPGAEL